VHGSEWDQACKGMKVVQNHRRHNRNPVWILWEICTNAAVFGGRR